MIEKIESTTESTFFKSFQMNNLITLLQSSIKKVIEKWLSDDDLKNNRIVLLESFSAHDASKNEFKDLDQLPGYIQRVWSDPHKIFTDLSDMSIEKIRVVISDAVRQELRGYSTTSQQTPLA